MPAFFLEVGSRHPIASFSIGRDLCVLVNEPEEIQRILVSEAGNFVKSRGFQRTRRVLGDGLLNSEGSFHLRQRRLAQQGFTKARLRAYAPAMARSAEELVGQWTPGERRNLLDDMNHLTLRIAALTLFSADITGQAAQVGKALDAFMQLFPRLLIPGSEWLERLPFQPLKTARAQLDQVIYAMIAERRRSGEPGEDLLGLLMAAVDDEGDGGRMNDLQLRDELVTMLLAGHETTANALTWALYLLALHPAWQESLGEESRALGPGPLGESDLERLPLARLVFAEAIRIFPPAWTTGRKCLREHRLGPWTMPGGTTFFLSPLVTQRDARFFPNPLAFDPYRFTPQASAARPRMTYFPFGAGIRQCIGERFAWMEGTLILTTLLREWRFAYPENRPPQLHGSLTLRPRGGLPMVLSKN